jgi:predicted metal-dependent HD superfamily phosphohydrolase
MPRPLSHSYWSQYADLSHRQRTPAVVEAMRGDFRVALGEELLGSVSNLGASTGRAIACSLFERMSDALLYYHTPLHILSIFSFAADHGISLERWEQLAIWFHDAIYIPSAPAGQNEAHSAIFMRSLIEGAVEPGLLHRAQSGIAATALHEQERVDPEFALILDLDLCNFCWDFAGYEAAGQNVAREMIPVCGEDAYRQGRRQFLADLRAKGSLYRSDLFRGRFEPAAQRNQGASTF